MDRRDTIRSMGLISAHALFPSILSGFIASCAGKTAEGTLQLEVYSPCFFSEKEFDVLRDVVDLILPATRTAAASQVHTHHFVDEVFAKCLTPDQQSLIRKGFSVFMSDFAAAGKKAELLTAVDEKAHQGVEAYAWFRPVKQYTLIGFFTSQEGTTNASNYVPVPGDYKGNIPMDDSTLNYGLTNQRYYL